MPRFVVALRHLVIPAVALLSASVPTLAQGDDLPADRRHLTTPSTSSADESEPFIWPELEETRVDAGDRSWASSDAETMIREAHLRKVAGAYGVSASLAGLSGTFLLIAAGHSTPETKSHWRYAALGTGCVSGAAFIAATVLWATTPPARGQSRLAVGPGAGLTLALSFD